MGAERELLGRTLEERYRIVEFLSEGGMGAVYRGRSLDDGLDVAIKIMREPLAKDATFVHRFEREAKTSARLEHRSTVRVHRYGIDGGRPFIVMDLVTGEDLQSLVERGGRLSEARAARLLAQVASALAAAHDLGIVHRDLKPENVMIARDPADPTTERVKVLDFGIAKIMDPELCSEDAPPRVDPPESDHEPDLTRVGALLGTPEYMAPEQLRGEPVDARTDLYACGILLHYMLTARVPLAGGSFAATHRLRLDFDPPALTDELPELNPQLSALVLSLLARDAGARPPCARALLERLTALLPDLSEELLAAGEPVEHAARVSVDCVTLPSDSIARSPVATPEPFLPADPPPREEQDHDLPRRRRDPGTMLVVRRARGARRLRSWRPRVPSRSDLRAVHVLLGTALGVIMGLMIARIIA